ncbi:hypothetical protein [Thomasclavelia sp.]
MGCKEKYQEYLKLAKDGKENGGEDEREQIVKVALAMYEKIKFIDKKDRTAIIEIMEILSNHDNWL